MTLNCLQSSSAIDSCLIDFKLVTWHIMITVFVSNAMLYLK